MMKLTMVILRLALLLLPLMSTTTNFRILQTARAWVVLPSEHTATATRRRRSRSTTTATTISHNVVFTRLSEDCLAAVQTAQETAIQLKQSTVDPSCLLLGVCQHPGRARATLEEYSITFEKIQSVLTYLQPSAASAAPPRLSDFSQKPATELPLATATQQALFQAGTLSQAMGARQIDPEHVLLSLLEYRENDQGEATAATRSDDCPAMETIYHLDATLEGEDICVSLLQSLLEQQQNQNDGDDAAAATATATTGANSEKGSAADDKLLGAPAGKKETAKAPGKSWLDECGIDLTQQAQDGALDRVHGRDAELQACFQTLVRRRKNNVCLTGEPGVGKTAIAEGLAQILVDPDRCPAALRGYRLVSLEVAALVAGTSYRGEFELRLRSIIDEVTTGPAKTILFIDEIHTLVGAGSTGDGSLDASNLLKPYLARGQLQLVGATTVSEYNKYIAKDAALERRFQPVSVAEPSVEQTVGILQAVRPAYRAHHRVEFTDAALDAAARLSDRYLSDRFLPDKALDLLDQAGALASLGRNATDLEAPEVTEHQVTGILSQWTGIPVGQLELDELGRLRLLEAALAQRVRGQERATKSVARAIRRARTGIRNPRRPIATFLFVGPTGTGKTELCKVLADTYFGSERDMIRIDGSEYMEKASATRLTGSSPGFVGYEEGGQLTEAVRRKPHSVVLFDELEKAHGDVLNILLQILEDGIMTDGQGRTVNFKNTVIVMTSNIGSRQLLAAAQEARNSGKDSKSAMKDDDEKAVYNKLSGIVKVELEKVLKPEFLNRIDDIVIFKPLTEKELSLIATMMIIEIVSRTKVERNLDITVSGALLEKMVHDGSKAADQFGARPMRRTVQRIFEDAISEAVVEGFLVEGDVAVFDLQQDGPANDDFMVVVVSRERDDETFLVEIEESTRDIVALVSDSSETSDDKDDDDEEDDDHHHHHHHHDDSRELNCSEPAYLMASD